MDKMIEMVEIIKSTENKILTEMNEINERIYELERKMIEKYGFSEINNKDHIFSKKIKFNNPIGLHFLCKPNYSCYDVGFKIVNNIGETIEIFSNNENLLLSIQLPCMGVWFINYRIDLNYTLGFSAVKSSQIILNGNSSDSFTNQIIIDRNTITTSQQINCSLSNSFIINITTENYIINLFSLFIFGRGNTLGNFTVLKNEDISNLIAVRIA